MTRVIPSPFGEGCDRILRIAYDVEMHAETLLSIARIYSQCIDLEERSRLESTDVSDEVSALRSEIHALLMQAFRQANIPFSDRADAARIAFELIKKPAA